MSCKNDREFLERMTMMDDMVDHWDNCGHCATQIAMAAAARELLEKNDVFDGMEKWTELWKEKWQATKYYKLYQQEKEAGRNPQDAFDERGWEM